MPDLSQMYILSQLRTVIETQHKMEALRRDHKLTPDEEKKHETFITSLKEGHCSGFAVVYAIMHAERHGDGWNNKLKEVKNLKLDHIRKILDLKSTLDEEWDSLPKSLKEGDPSDFALIRKLLYAEGHGGWWNELHKSADINLEEVDLTEDSARSRMRNLENICREPINFILPHQRPAEFLDEDANQTSILRPPRENEEPVVKFTRTKNGQPHTVTISSHTSIGWWYSQENLMGFLNRQKGDIKNNPFIVGNRKHATALRIDKDDNGNDQWIFHDPNCIRIETIKEIFKDKPEILGAILAENDVEDGKVFEFKSSDTAVLAKIIISQLGQNLGFRLFSFDKKEFDFSPEFKHLDIYRGLDSYGLHSMARDAPELLPQVFDYIERRNPISKISLIFSLFRGIEHNIDDNGWTGLHMIVQNAPEQLPKLFEFIEPEEILTRIRLFRAIAYPSKDGITGLDMIVQYAPNQLSKLFELVDTADVATKKDLLNFLFEAIAHFNEHGWTGLHTMANNPDARDLLPKLLEFVDTVEDVNKKYLLDLLLQAIPHPDNYLLGLHIQRMIPEKFVQSLFEKDSDGESIISLIEEKHEEYSPQVFDIVLKNLSSISNTAYQKLETYISESSRQIREVFSERVNEHLRKIIYDEEGWGKKGKNLAGFGTKCPAHILKMRKIYEDGNLSSEEKFAKIKELAGDAINPGLFKWIKAIYRSKPTEALYEEINTNNSSSKVLYGLRQNTFFNSRNSGGSPNQQTQSLAVVNDSHDEGNVLKNK